MVAATLNTGYTYRNRVSSGDLAGGLTVCGFYAARYPHSSRAVWLERLRAGQISRNGISLDADAPLAPGDRLAWHRPPWLEPAVPELPDPLFDDGDLLVFDKPSGVPVMPAGGFLEHTLLRQLERRVACGSLEASTGLPRPVHRLGRHTSGLLVCARRPGTRAWLSALLRDSTAAPRAAAADPVVCRKLYRALLAPLPPELAVGASQRVTTPIGRAPHPLLGRIWCAGGEGALAAESEVTLLERRAEGCLVAVGIATGRPHQIRIHSAFLGAPLVGDPLYRPGGAARPTVLPGEGGYRLHAHRLRLSLPGGGVLELEAPLPPGLR